MVVKLKELAALPSSSKQSGSSVGVSLLSFLQNARQS